MGGGRFGGALGERALPGVIRRSRGTRDPIGGRLGGRGATALPQGAIRRPRRGTAFLCDFVRIVIDLNDGVRLNIRPFFEAGVLREKAQKLYIKWGKTAARTSPPPRGTPSCINDHHITLAEKAAAREVK